MKLRPVRKYAIHRWWFRTWLKLKLCFQVLFKQKHAVVIYFTTQDLEDLIVYDKTYNETFHLQFIGCMQHHGLRIIKECAERIPEEDIILDRLMFDVEAAELLNANKENPFQ